LQCSPPFEKINPRKRNALRGARSERRAPSDMATCAERIAGAVGWAKRAQRARPPRSINKELFVGGHGGFAALARPANCSRSNSGHGLLTRIRMKVLTCPPSAS